MGCATLNYDLKGERFSAVVCGGRGIKPCIACGQLATRQCDFKLVRSGVSRHGLPWRRKGTCDVYLCATCTTRLPGDKDDKDACPEHAPICVEACRRAGIQLELVPG